MPKGKPVFLTIYVTIFLLYIFAPLFLIFIFAWNNGEGYNLPLQGATWKWFQEFFSDKIALRSIKNSLLIAVSSATISTLLGTGFTLGILKGVSKFKNSFLTIMLLPILMPSLTIGIAGLTFFRTLNIPLGIPVVILSHVSISISYIFIIIMGRVEGIYMEIQEAAIDLGASWFSSLKDVVLPAILPAIIAAWLFSFMISWNEFIITYFLVGTEMTLPIYIFSQLRFGISPKVNVISVLITLFTIFIILTLNTTRHLYFKIKSITTDKISN